MNILKSLAERYKDDILTNNEALNHFSQCKDCIFRDKVFLDGKEYGYDKSHCRIFGKDSAIKLKLNLSYVPIENVDKPEGVYDNSELCEYYEKEKKAK